MARSLSRSSGESPGEQAITDHDQAITDFREHLLGGWQENCCLKCSDTYYQKASSADETCGAFSCEGGYAFIDSKPSRRSYIPALSVGTKFRTFFNSLGYDETESIPMTGHAEHTIFTGTAGQIFDRAIFDEEEFDSSPLYIAQPVVRMQQADVDGFTRSFVNISLEQLDATVADHLSSFEHYLDFLSQLGIYAGDLRIKIYTALPDWGKGRFSSAVMGVYYDGLEIGVLNYFTDIPQETRDNLRMSDISFGLERLAWALNRNPRFIDTAGPPAEMLRNTPHSQLDAYRTIALILQSGVRPDNSTQAGGKLRKLFDDIPAFEPVRYDLLAYYDQWWKNFNDNSVIPQATAIATYEQELTRRLATALRLEDGGFQMPNSPDELIGQIVTSGLVRANEVRSRRQP